MNGRQIDAVNNALEKKDAEIEQLKAEADKSWLKREELKAEINKLKTENEARRLQWEAAKREAEKIIYESGFKLGEAHKKIARLTKENIDRLMQKVRLEEEIQRMRSSPTSKEVDDLIERLRAFNTAGWPLIEEATEALHRLARNQITASHTTIAQAAAIQAQHASASMREADAQMQRADALDAKCTTFTNALLTAMSLIDQLVTENGRLCAASDAPPNINLFAAKHSFDAAMKRLLGNA